MTYVIDFGILAAIAVGYIVAALIGAVTLTRIGLGVRDFLNRNDR